MSFSPVVALRVHRWFTWWIVEQKRADGKTDHFGCCQAVESSKQCLADAAARKRMVVSPDGMSAHRPENWWVETGH